MGEILDLAVGELAIGYVERDGLILDQKIAVIEQGLMGTQQPADLAIAADDFDFLGGPRNLRGQFFEGHVQDFGCLAGHDRRLGIVGLEQACADGIVPRHSEKPAKRFVDKGQGAVEQTAKNEFALGLDDRPIERLAAA